MRYRHLAYLYAVAQRVIQPYGGTLQPVLGEHVLAVFGAPVAQEDHAQRAVLAALELQRRVREADPERGAPPAEGLVLRVGLYTGQVAVGALAENSAGAASIIGAALSGALALQAQAAPGMILCSAVTAHLVQGLVRIAAVAPVPMAGEPAPVAAYTILGSYRRRRPFRGRERRVWTPFVGRQRELATLRALLTQVEAGRGQVVGVIGEPGVGKSRLCYEFSRSLRGQPLTYLAASGVSHGTASPFLPILALLRQHCGLTEGDTPATLTAKVRASLQDVGLAPDERSPYLLHLLGTPPGAEGVAELSPEGLKARTLDALVQLALHGARRRPLVLEIENVHWIDPSSEEVVAALVERLAGARILLLLTYRPGYRPGWTDKSYATQLALSRLAPRDSRRLVQAVIQAAPVPDGVVPAMLARAEGNPLFLEELARAALEHGDDRQMVLPETLQAVLAARVDRLPSESKRLLQMAAVIGKDIPVPLLQAIAGIPDAALDLCLTHLQAVELLYATMDGAERTMTFKHALTREATYQSLLRSTRQEYHQRSAQVLAAHFPEIVDTQPELVAHHYTEAGLGEQAIPYWRRAGQQARQRSANLEAVQHLTKGLELLATLPETPARAQQELDLQIAQGLALMATKGHAAPEVEQTYARARTLCQQVGETPQLFATIQGLCEFYHTRGALLTARELGEQLDRLAQHEVAPTPRLEAHAVLGNTLFMLGEYAAAWTHLEQGISLIDSTVPRAQALLHSVAPGVRCLALAANTLWCLGSPAQAVRRSQEALALAQALAHPPSLAYAQHFAAFLHHRRREAPAVQAQAEALLTLATAQGFPHYVGYGTCWQGGALAAQGEGEAGLAQMRQGLETLLATGLELSRPLCLVLLAEAAGQADQVTEGLRLLAEALAAFEASGRGDLLAEAYRLQGTLLLRQAVPEATQGEACFQQALAIARRQQAKSWELRAAMSLARLRQQQGKRDKARALLAPIYGWFTEGFDTADLQEAKALLKDLPGL